MSGGGAPATALRRLESRISSYGSPGALVAFSGGVDSAVVLASAARALGRGAITAVTAISPSYPRGELDVARATAAALGVAIHTVRTREVSNPAYARNGALRCYHCKAELAEVLRRIAEETGDVGTSGPTVLLAGANADDRADFRPGLRATEEFGIPNPLLEEGLGKAAVRSVARLLGLAVADRPAMACLSSRVAFGIPITPALLARIDAAERRVRAMGFEHVRVRHHGGRAIIEVEPGAVDRLRVDPGTPEMLGALRTMGWSDVEIDPAGYRIGSMNRTLLGLRRRTRG